MASFFKKIIRGFFAVLCFLGALWVFGFLYFFYFIMPPVSQDKTPTDAIVVLTGDNHRLEEAYKLLSDGLSDQLLISGVEPFFTVKSLLFSSPFLPLQEKRQLLQQSSKITLGHVAKNTIGNAEETSQWVRYNNIQSIRLVTHAYHMPRTLLEFRRAMPSTSLVVHGIASQRDWKMVPREYTKYVFAWCRDKLIKLDKFLSQ